MPKPLPFALALSVALVVGCGRQAAAPEPVRAVRTQTVAVGDMARTLEFAAEVRAQTESRLSFRVGGKLVQRAAGLGDEVKAGQVLAQLDPQDLRLSEGAAQAALQAAQVNLEQAEADFKRFRELRDQGFISSAELERRDTLLKSARAQVQQANAQAGTQRNQARYAALVADVPGVVTGVEAEPGMVVAAGTPILRVAHHGPRDAVFSVPEDKVDLLRALGSQPGALSVRRWGNSSEVIPAVVREIAAAADPVTRTFLVKADVGATDLRLGQTATVLLQTPKQAGVIRLPLAAVMQLQGRTVVWLLDPTSMTVKPQPVRVGTADGNQVVIAEGLHPGQQVVVAGVHVLSTGQKVKRYVEPTVAAALTQS
jgi:multidrug efflux system membrane fusion protein